MMVREMKIIIQVIRLQPGGNLGMEGFAEKDSHPWRELAPVREPFSLILRFRKYYKSSDSRRRCERPRRIAMTIKRNNPTKARTMATFIANIKKPTKAISCFNRAITRIIIVRMPPQRPDVAKKQSISII